MKAKVLVRLKEDVPDNQGKHVQQRLAARGFHEVAEARVGKLIELTLSGGDRDAANSRIKQMCQQLLVNEVVEEFEILEIE